MIVCKKSYPAGQVENPHRAIPATPAEIILWTQTDRVYGTGDFIGVGKSPPPVARSHDDATRNRSHPLASENA